MKIIVLGGAGGMGATACRQLAAGGALDELVVADLDGARAAKVANELAAKGARATSRAIDVLDASALRALLGGTDLVLNCAGPFFRLGVPTLEAAIDSGTHYLDICDDPEPTLAMLELDEKARGAGVFAVIGMGASPGVSNLLAARAAKRLERVDDCFTAWPLDGAAIPGGDGDLREAGSDAAGRPSAAAVHLMEQISGTIRIVEGGRLVERAPLRPIEIDYPGAGRGTVYSVGHPEPLTLLGSLGIRGRAANAMLLRPATAAYLESLAKEIDSGALTHEAAASEILSPRTGRGLAAAAKGLLLRGAGALPPFFAWLRGARQGRSVTVGCHVTSLPPGMDGATAIPAALAVEALLRERPAPGVHAPEAVIDPDAFLSVLARHCPGSPESADALAPVVEREEAAR